MWTKSTITQTLKIAKIKELIFHSFQRITHQSCKYGHFWGEGGMGPPCPQKWSYLHEKCAQCWIKLKINFTILAIFSFWYMVVFVLKIGQFSINFEYKYDHNSIRFISLPIFSVNVTTFERFLIFGRRHLKIQVCHP